MAMGDVKKVFANLEETGRPDWKYILSVLEGYTPGSAPPRPRPPGGGPGGGGPVGPVDPGYSPPWAQIPVDPDYGIPEVPEVPEVPEGVLVYLFQATAGETPPEGPSANAEVVKVKRPGLKDSWGWVEPSEGPVAKKKK